MKFPFFSKNYQRALCIGLLAATTPLVYTSCGDSQPDPQKILATLQAQELTPEQMEERLKAITPDYFYSSWSFLDYAFKSNQYEVIYLNYKLGKLNDSGRRVSEDASPDMLQFILQMDKENKVNLTIEDAVYHKRLDIVRQLISNGADASKWLTPLSIALINNDLAQVKKICKENPQAVNQPNPSTNRWQRSYPIHWISSVEHLDLLLAHGVDLNPGTGDNLTTRAVLYGTPELVEKLIHLGHPINDDINPLTSAAYLGDIAKAKLLLKYGANVNAHIEEHTQWKPSPLAIAVESNHTEVADLLIENGAIIKAQLPSYFVLRNNHKALAYLLKKGININRRGMYGETLLHEAIQSKNAKIAEMLLDAGAEVDIQDEEGNTPLYYATARNSKAIVEMLLDEGADMFVKNKAGYTPADRCLVSADMLRFYLSEGLKEDYKFRVNDTEISLVHAAIQLGMEKEALSMLAEADIEEKDAYGDTLLHSAALRGMKELAEKLIEKGISATAANKNGNTPLHYAAKTGHEAICNLLFQHGAKATARNKFNRTPLHMAALGGHAQVFSLMEKHGAKASDVCSTGNTCLHYAARGGNKILVEYLLQNNSNLNTTNAAGDTPLLAVADTGNKEIMKLLIEKGSDPSISNNKGDTLAKKLARHRRKDFSDILALSNKAIKKDKLASWSPNNISTEWTELKFTHPASYFKQSRAIEFNYTSGSARLDIKKIAFSVDGKTVVEIPNDGFAGIPSRNNICELHNELNNIKDSSNCCMHVYIKAHENNDSYGDIILHQLGKTAETNKKLASWSPNNISTEWTELKFTRPASFFKQYKAVKFKYTSGSARLNIQKIVFSANRKTIAEVKHDGYAGYPSHNNIYDFKNALKNVKDNEKCSIYLYVQAHEVNDSYGDIILQK